MIKDYFEELETHFGRMIQPQKDLLQRALTEIKEGYEQNSFASIYNSEGKKEAYALHYGPIYAMQSTISLGNANSLEFFPRQPDRIFVHGCAHFPESYGIERLFSIKKWNPKKTKIILLEREFGWLPLIDSISRIKEYEFEPIDFIEDKVQASEIYSGSKIPLYIFQNCLNEDNHENVKKVIIGCYNEAPKGAVFLISSILPVDWKIFRSRLEDIETHIVEMGVSKKKLFNDELCHYPCFTHSPFDSKNLSIVPREDTKGRHFIRLKKLLGTKFDQYNEKYISIKSKMTFVYTLLRK